MPPANPKHFPITIQLKHSHRDSHHPAVPFEFHVSRIARERYAFDLSMFSTTGNVVFANFYAARLFAQKINQIRSMEGKGETLISPAQLNAMGLIDEILHAVLQRYREEIKPGVFQESLDWLQEKFGVAELDRTLLRFVHEFPPLAVYRGEIDEKSYLSGQTNGISNREIAIEELMLLWLANLNPALADFQELFDDSQLREETLYTNMMSEFEQFFETQPLFGPGAGGQNLFRLLRQPALDAPFSLADQLRFLRMNWGTLIESDFPLDWDTLLNSDFMDRWGTPTADYEVRLLRNIDFIQEEQKERFNPGLGPAPTHVPQYDDAYDEPEAFSADLDWMPHLVLIAKSTLVWLNQLSQQYQREITRLDQIPDETLDQLASWGITGLWLIGLWERSQASKRIKHLCGNPDAEASAYALYDYQVAEELGGQQAYDVLKDRCWQRGIRMGSDMVPNHSGIDSRLIHEHPDWFVQNSHPPFPAYRFEGINLSSKPHSGIYLEDHYYDRTDAAVVFKHVDHQSGKTRYIYHGNDGTSMPWNDTAQLNYLLPQVRESIIQTILRVARMSPIIRFDAAMTLAKKHFHRLWFPQPGSGGDIPSRAEHGLTKAQFDKLMPVEFWREVVDRVAVEAPDTLLLAEAFWLMEGYFVRTLGMHRVYNSAFMHMLKNEENKKYRYTIKNTLEFEPEVLKRYVNFMNNPDEETAIAQFGDGDKYFGVSVMMATMPGLPMLGHGQIEGFREKYGMEYRRAYMDEKPNEYLINRHQKEVFPLFKRRYLFAEVKNFLLYDFYLQNGSVNENVFAYSNRKGNERCLIVFNNAYQQTRGWIRTSAAFSQKAGSTKQLAQRTLVEGLDVPEGENDFCIYRDHISGLEYIHRCKTLAERGMYVELGGYKYQVMLNFRVVQDGDDREYDRLVGFLGGHGVTSIAEALRERHLQPLHHAFRQCFSAEMLTTLLQLRSGEKTGSTIESLSDQIENAFIRLLTVSVDFADAETVPAIDDRAQRLKKSIGQLAAFTPGTVSSLLPAKPTAVQRQSLKRLELLQENTRFETAVLAISILLNAVDQQEPETATEPASSEKWLLNKVIHSELQTWGLVHEEAQLASDIGRLLAAAGKWFPKKGTAATVAASALEKAIAGRSLGRFIQMHQFDNVEWFNKERFELAIEWLFLAEFFHAFSALQADFARKPTAADRKTAASALSRVTGIFAQWKKNLEASGYRMDQLLKPTSSKKSARKAPTVKAKRVKEVQQPKTVTKKTGSKSKAQNSATDKKNAKTKRKKKTGKESS